MLSLALACAAPETDHRPRRDDPHGSAQGPLVDVAVGDRAVDFVLEGHDGAPIRLTDHRGDVIVLELSGFH